MSESLSSTPLTDQALTRLRKLAEGNGLAPEKIELFGTEEKIYTLQGVLTLTPKCDIETGRYSGPARGGKGRQVFPNFDAMHAEAAKRKQEFESGRSWLETSLKELKAAPGEGWGLEGARITLPEQTITLTASTGCPACHGQKLITCSQCGGQGSFVCGFCHGSRQEVCYGCGGTGNNPQNPTQPCTICNGRRFTTCRHCQGTGQMTCPTCHGRRGTPCPTCKASGLVSEDIAIHCGVDTRFKMENEGLPSGLRNGLGRLGLANLGKGHADITILKPQTENNDDAPTATSLETDKKISSHDILYEAKLPYADLRMNFNGHKAVVSAFGKRGALLGVPPFLDDALKPARTKLALAAVDATSFDEALQTRAVSEALQLELSGKGTIKEFRRFYSVGLSQEAMKEILGNLHLALKKQTLKTRSIIATVWSFISGAVFAGLFITGIEAKMVQGWPPALQMGFDLAALILPMLLSWLALGLATRASLQRRYHSHTIALQQKLGKTGYGMLAAIIILYGLILILAPLKPSWLSIILH